MKKMKKTALYVLTAVFTLSLFLFTACPDPTDDSTDETPNVPLADLTGTVWAGETPRAGDWLTLTFRAGSILTASFVADNTSNEWTFVYVSAAKTGTITTGSSWSPAPEGFSISADAKTLSIPNYGGHGATKTFKRLRQADLTIDSNPYSTGALPNQLVGTVWAGSTPAASDTGWVTISFRAKQSTGSESTSMTGTNVAVISYAHDSTTAVWDYTYDDATGAGTGFTNGHKPDDSPTTWNPGAYTISADGKTMTCSNFMGAERSFKRYR